MDGRTVSADGATVATRGNFDALSCAFWPSSTATAVYRDGACTRSAHGRLSIWRIEACRDHGTYLPIQVSICVPRIQSLGDEDGVGKFVDRLRRGVPQAFDVLRRQAESKLHTQLRKKRRDDIWIEH